MTKKLAQVSATPISCNIFVGLEVDTYRTETRQVMVLIPQNHAAHVVCLRNSRYCVGMAKKLALTSVTLINKLTRSSIELSIDKSRTRV